MLRIIKKTQIPPDKAGRKITLRALSQQNCTQDGGGVGVALRVVLEKTAFEDRQSYKEKSLQEMS